MCVLELDLGALPQQGRQPGCVSWWRSREFPGDAADGGHVVGVAVIEGKEAVIAGGGLVQLRIGGFEQAVPPPPGAAKDVDGVHLQAVGPAEA